MTNTEHSLFVQDDWKVSSRLTANIGLRYEIYGADTEKEDRLVNFDPVAPRLIYAGEDGASRTVNKKTRHNLAPRLGLAWDMTGDARNVLRGGYGKSYFPLAAVRLQPARPAGALHDLAELQRGDQPHRLLPPGAAALEPVPADRAGQAADHGRAERGQPARPRPRLRERDAVACRPGRSATSGSSPRPSWPRSPTWAARATTSSSASTRTRCSRARAHRPRGGSSSRCPTCPTSSSATRPTSRATTACRASCSSASRPACSSWPATRSASRSTTAGRRRRAAARWATAQTVTRIDLSRGPSGFDVKHRFVLSYVWDLPFGKDHRWPSSGDRQRPPRQLAVQRDRHPRHAAGPSRSS